MTIRRRTLLTLVPMAALTACSDADDNEEPTAALVSPEITLPLGEAVARKLEVTGGRGPYTWSRLAGDDLGLSLTAEGVISGMPRRPGRSTWSLQIKDPSGGVVAIQSLDVTVSASGKATPNVVAVGTSLAASIDGVHCWTHFWPLMTGMHSLTWGWPGAKSQSIAARWGATPYALAQPAELPATGPVSLSLDIPVIRGAEPAELAGVAGRLSLVNEEDRDSTRVVFTRNKPGAPKKLPAGTQLWRRPDISSAAGFTPVIDLARNDSPDISRLTIRRYERMVERFTAGIKSSRFLVIGQPMASTDSARDRADRQRVNDAIERAFPGNYVDPWAYLRSDDCAQFLNLRWTAQDQSDIALGVTPKSLRLDTLHPNEAASRALAHFYKAEMQRRGWL